jgi:phosphoglucomutase
MDEWLSTPICAPQREAILGHLRAEQFPLLLDAFYQLVPFGTGGRRGRVGYGPNRINPSTVALSVQGHCNYLRETGEAAASSRIVIAFDTRIFSDIAGAYCFLGGAHPLLGLTSRALARQAAEIYAANGFEVFLAGLNSEGEFLSTPELSFAIRHLGALGGMNVSASHNHPDDNGFKFFNQQGAQDVPPTDQLMASFMNDVAEVHRVGFEEAAGDRRIRALPADLHGAYLKINLALRSKPAMPLTVVYTPLCGTGNGSVGDVLRAAGYDVRVYGPHNTFDGTFAAVPLRLPNPEVPVSATPAIPLADEVKADLLLCTDPDADRLGVFARDAQGAWRYLNGNEIASILAYYLCVDSEFGPRRSGFLIKTLVTTRTLFRIAERSGCGIVGDLLVGFKYIADVLYRLERDGYFEYLEASPANLVMAGEESHGVLLTPEIRDKDAAGGALVLCELASQLHASGRHLPEYLDALALECGNHQNAARSVVMRGIRGVSLLADMMKALRDNPPASFGDLQVLRAKDLLSPECGPIRSDTEKLSRNFLVYDLEMAQVVVRPSGTEPKAKVYVDVEGSKLPAANDRQAAAQFAQDLAASVVDACIARIGFQLSPSAKLLPDYVDLDLKAAFDTQFRPELDAAAGKLSRQSRADQQAWLRARLAPYGSGSDPLAPAGPALRQLFEDLGLKGLNEAVA